MTLTAHVAAHPDQLIRLLGGAMLEVGGDPFARQVVAVPTRGIQRWLTQRIAIEIGMGGGAGDGICANVDFRSPGALVSRVVRAPAWRSRRPPGEGPALTAHVVEAVDHHLDEPWLRVLARHLAHPESANRWVRRRPRSPGSSPRTPGDAPR